MFFLIMYQKLPLLSSFDNKIDVKATGMTRNCGRAKNENPASAKSRGDLSTPEFIDDMVSTVS